MFDLVDLGERSRQAADVDVSSLSDDELLAAAVQWQQVVSAAEVGAGQVLGELQKRGCTEARFGLKTQAWVASEANVDRRVVVRRLRSGRYLRFLPHVCDAVVAGDLTSDHAAEMALASSNPRVGDEIVAGQAFWVEVARSTSFADWQQQLRHTVAELDQSGGYDPNRDLARNKLRLSPYPDGVLNFGGELVGERALGVRQAVEAHADILYRRLKNDHDLCPELPLPRRATVLAMALAELVMLGAALDRDATPGPAIDITLVIEAEPTHPDNTNVRTETADRSGTARGSSATGTADTADTTGTASGSSDPLRRGDTSDVSDGPDPTRGSTSVETLECTGHGHPADPTGHGCSQPADSNHDHGSGHSADPTLHGCGDHADPRRDPNIHGSDGDGCGHAELARLLASRPVYTPDGYRVSPEVAAALVCDPVIQALIVDTLGVPLDLGRQIRFANRAQRRALARRDGGCVFPGCDAPVGWCDAHHVTWWRNGGTTDIANLALLCRYHHGISHRDGWTMTALADQTFTWTTPLGQTLTSQRHRGRSPTR